MKRLTFFILPCLLLLLSAPLASPPAQAGTPTPEPETHPAYVPGELIVVLKPNASQEALGLPMGADLSDENSELESLHTFIVEVNPGQEEAAREQILADPAVLFVEYNYYVQAAITPNDPLYTNPNHYGTQRIQAESAWDITTGSSGVIVAVLDSGIDPNHIEFAGRLLPGYDYVQDDWEPWDEYGHGTHAAGIIGATGNNGVGMAGMNWHARILPLRVLDASGWGTVSDVAAALIYAADQGAKVINMSLGGVFQSTVLEQASYYAYRKGAALFAASGSSGAGVVLSPANYPWVMAVGATDQSDVRASISNFGAELDIMAPGVNILSTYPGGIYYSLTGTSFACPYVAGAAALLASLPAFDTPDEIYYALRHTAKDLDAPGFDTLTGYGLLQTADALNEDLSGYMTPDAVEYDILSNTSCSSEVYFYWVDATGGTYVFLPSNGDNTSESVALPFTFNFGGVPYVSVRISSNGYLTFDTFGNIADNAPLPQMGPPNQVVAPFWDDLNPSASSNPAKGIYTFILGTAPNRQFVIEWYGIPIQANNTSTELTFEAILYENSGDIGFQYLTLQGDQSDGASATIGLEYQDGASAAQYAYNRTGALAQGQIIRFIRQTPGTTRTYADCLTAQPVNNSGKTLSLNPWTVVVPSGLVPSGTQSTLSLASLSTFSPSWSKYLDLQHYADIRFNPSPPAPFSPRLEVRYAYTPQDILQAGGRPENLFLARYDPQVNTWEQLTTTLDEENHQLVAQVSHLSIFGVYTLQPPQDLPVTGDSRSLPLAESLVSFALLGLSILVYQWQKHILRSA